MKFTNLTRRTEIGANCYFLEMDGHSFVLDCGMHPKFEGEEALRAQLTKNNPVIVMLAVSAGRFLRWDLPGGHWMVAYGFDADGVYLTNYGKMGWPDFRAGWNGLAPRLISMHRRGLAILPRAA